MKTNIDDATLQAAIDAACEETTVPNGYQSLDLRPTYAGWKGETLARLHLLKSALARLPEPTPPVVDGNKPDPYAELKAAYAEGKRIQTQSREDSKWSDWSFPVEPLWNTPPNRYRIKPEPEPTQPWAVGDKVKLKGGSFTMTVEQADSDGIACEWHDSSGVPQARTYTTETLQPA